MEKNEKKKKLLEMMKQSDQETTKAKVYELERKVVEFQKRFEALEKDFKRLGTELRNSRNYLPGGEM